MLGLERSLGSRIVTYADDLVILCRKGKAEVALQRLRAIMGKLKLTVNEEKTRICKVPEGEFDFLGHTFGRMYSELNPRWLKLLLRCRERSKGSGANAADDYVQRVKDFAAFLGRSPATASKEDVRRYQLHVSSNGSGTPKINSTVSALRFFFDVT